MGIFKKLGWFFKEEKKSYLIGVFSLFIVALLQLIPPRVIGIVVDEIATKRLTRQSLLMWLGVLLASAVGQYVLRYVWRTRIWGNAAKLERIVRQRLYHHFTQMDNQFFQKYRTGDLMAHATNDIKGVGRVAGAGILTSADAISVGVTTILAMLFVVDWRLTLIAIIPLPLLAIASRVLGKLLHTRFRESQASFSNLNDKVQESIQGIKVVKTFGQEEEDIDEFKEKSADIVEKNRKVYQVDSLFDPIITFIIGVSYVLTISVGGILIMENAITIGDFITFVNYIGMLVWPMFAIGRLFNIIERGNASYTRIEQLMVEKPSILEQEKAITTPVTGDISFDIQSFVYPDASTPALENIQLDIKQGETLGVVGKTGSGKTTLFKLLTREYDLYEGSITYNGHDIRDYSLNALLGAIGYVPQDNYLFSTTVRENIRFSDPTLSQEAVEQAATLTDVHEDILGFPKGYDTEVGERGVSLSGGQKQRISIARAVIQAPELLILDDSLSAVDAETEETILSGLKQQRGDQTMILAAHRISSVMHADEIIVMDEGKIVERGTHEQLVSLDGWYKEMYDKQQLEKSLKGVVGE